MATEFRAVNGTARAAAMHPCIPTSQA